MRYTVSVQSVNHHFAWSVTDELGGPMDSGAENNWTEALSQATLVLAVNLGNHFGAPPIYGSSLDGQGE